MSDLLIPESQLKRYPAPFFGELLLSEIATGKVKEYREGIHTDSINKTLLTLAQILDESEDAGWIERNVARGRRTREPLERRRNRGALDVDDVLALLEAADQLDNHHRPATLEKAAHVRRRRDDAGLRYGSRS